MHLFLLKLSLIPERRELHPQNIRQIRAHSGMLPNVRGSSSNIRSSLSIARYLPHSRQDVYLPKDTRGELRGIRFGLRGVQKGSGFGGSSLESSSLHLLVSR